MSVKKLIAREGLIFLGVILTALIIVFISSIYQPRLKALDNKGSQIKFKPLEEIEGKGSLTEEEWVELKALEEEKIRKELENGVNDWVDVSYQYPADITVKIKENKPLTDADIFVIEKINLAKEAEIEKINLAKEVEYRREQIKWGSLKILLIAYFLYLIPARFSIWAIRTLRQKE